MVGKVTFREHVYRVVHAIPAGKVMTYGAVARSAGSPQAARAVGTLLSRNPAPMGRVGLSGLPCHRVVMSDGRLGGYILGVSKKAALLRAEGVPVHANRVAAIYIS
ncbi:MAG: MGMT family protein [Patescibacteria group bacterium]